MNNIIRNFNKNKLDDLLIIHKKLSLAEPRFGASCEELLKEVDRITNLSGAFIYYYVLLEMSEINIKKYKDDEDTLNDIYESIKDNYDQYCRILEEIKEE